MNKIKTKRLNRNDKKDKKKDNSFSEQGLELPIEDIKKLTNQPPQRIQSQMMEMSGAPEGLALIHGKIPHKNIAKVLQIIEKREENSEKERRRQYNAFLINKIKL